MECIFLASPTTRTERLALIDEASTGFIYYVSRVGVTGTQTQLSRTLETEVRNLRSKVQAPLGVGFGISTAEQAATVATFSDGVIVGSAIVRLIEDNPEIAQAEEKIGRFAREILGAIRTSGRVI